MMIDSDDSSSYGYSMHNATGTHSSLEKKKSYDMNVTTRNYEITRRDIQGRTLLHYFSFRGDLENAKKLMNYSFPVDLTDNNLNSSLHVASEFAQPYLVQFLLERGALINRQNMNGKTALHLAVEKNNKQIADLLLAHGANPNIVDLEGASALHYASAYGYQEISSALLNRGAFVNIKDYSKETPLFWAIRESKIEMVELLIRNGANLNSSNDDGETPLDLAHEFDEDDISLLIQKALNPSSLSSANYNFNFPLKSQPLNFVNPKSEQPIPEYRPQSL